MNEIVEIPVSKRYPPWFTRVLGIALLPTMIWYMNKQINELLAYGNIHGFASFFQSPLTVGEYEILDQIAGGLFMLALSGTMLFRRVRRWVTLIPAGFLFLYTAFKSYGSSVGVNEIDGAREGLLVVFGYLFTAFVVIGLPVLFIYRKYIRKTPETDPSQQN